MMAASLSSCFIGNHIKLSAKAHDANDRYDDLRKGETSPSEGSALSYVGSYLDEARSANRRWDNVRARLFIGLANEQMDFIEHPPQLPPTLTPIYENLRSVEPQ